MTNRRHTTLGGTASGMINYGLVALTGDSEQIGTWRSLVAHLTGGQGVAGSNPVVPTNQLAGDSEFSFWYEAFRRCGTRGISEMICAFRRIIWSCFEY